MLPPDQPSGPALAELIRAVGKDLLARARADRSPSALAAVAMQRFEELARYLGQLVGELGVHALFARSAAAARSTYPWIPATPPNDAPWVSLREAMETQDVRAVEAAFLDLLSTFVELLARLIGEDLVRRLLHDVWGEVFPQASKEST